MVEITEEIGDVSFSSSNPHHEKKKKKTMTQIQPVQKQKQQQKQKQHGSRLFQPHRTVGLITTSQPYTLSPQSGASSSLDTFVTIPLLERFLIYKCDTLRPVLISDCLSSTRTRHYYSKEEEENEEEKKKKVTKKSRSGEKMYHAITDQSLSITVGTHAHSGKNRATHVSLYKRTRVIDVQRIVKASSSSGSGGGGGGGGASWGIVDVVNLGRSKFRKEGEDDNNDHDDNEEEEGENKKEIKMENRMVLAFICAKVPSSDDVTDTDIEVIGDSDDENDDDDDDDDGDDDDDDSSIESKDSNSTQSSTDDDDDSSSSDEEEDEEEEDDDNEDIHGEVVIVLASRYSLTIQNRIPLKSAPSFIPNVAIHPHTYLNKIALGSLTGELLLLNIRTGKVIHQFKCLKGPKSTSSSISRSNNPYRNKITTMEQSPAVDTIAVGTASGEVHLVNIRLDKKLFSLHHGKTRQQQQRGYDNSGTVGITSLSFRTDGSALGYGIAPMAVGQKDGTISIWDLTPRSDDDDDDDNDDDHDDEMMLKQSKHKNVRRTLLTQMEKVHPGGVSNLTFLPQEPLLLSSGTRSNSLIMHLFDNPNHTGRILRSRVGHTAPPRLVRYQYSSNGCVLASMADGTDASSCQILSCGGKGDKSLRMFNTARSVLDREFSQGQGLSKKARELGLEGGKSDLLLKEITGMATCEARTKDWGDLVTIHKDHAMAYVWSTKRKAQSGPVLRQEDWNVSAMKVQPPKKFHATALALSACGNFAVVGTKGGVIFKYNIQSGVARGSFPRDATGTNANQKRTIAGDINRTTRMLERSLKVHKVHDKETDLDKHEAEKVRNAKLANASHKDAAVVGLAVDSLNKTLISVGVDGKLILWSFATHAPHRRSPIRLPKPATKLIHTRDSDLIAIALEDFSIVLFDFSSLSIVRTFGKQSNARHEGPITDMAFGPDGRKLYSSSMDGTLRVWDIPTNTCVDWLTFSSTPMSLSLSTTGEFLCTSHSGRLGISLWCDRSFFQTVHLNGASPPTKPIHMDEPAAIAEEASNDDLDGKQVGNQGVQHQTSEKSDDEGDDDELGPPVPKEDGLITLSGLPAAHWKNLFHLEVVKERNKPTEAPKKPENAPFFLQWRGGQGSVDPNNTLKDDTDKKNIEDNDDEWESAWNDDDNNMDVAENDDSTNTAVNKRKADESPPEDSNKLKDSSIVKRKKVTHFRSDFASLLVKCSEQAQKSSSQVSNDFEQVTEYIASLGPSAIDVAFSSLCHGTHDLEYGLNLLHLASLWLLESCKSRKNYEAVNAYLHRFLHLHAATISDIALDVVNVSNEESKTKEHEERCTLMETITELRAAQKVAAQKLRGKMQHTLCLLRHFSRMV